MSRLLYLRGELVPYEKALVNVQCNAMKYGSSVFEGVRAYYSGAREELFVFKLAEHVTRLFESLRIMRMDLPCSREEATRSILATLQANAYREDVLVRQSAFVDGDGLMELAGPVGLAVDAQPRRLGTKDGVNACISSWTRISDRAMPPRIKCSANYQNGRLAMLEARAGGYDVAILLNAQGKVAEAPGACLFMVRDGVPVTPPVTADILESVTRATLLELFEKKLGLRPVVREIDRTELYVAEEVFLCGSGWEITPVLSVDRLAVGNQGVGPITTALRKTYDDVVRGACPEYEMWLTPVHGGRAPA